MISRRSKNEVNRRHSAYDRGMQFFRRRHDRGRPPHQDVLTPAEWRVLEQLREGRPNAEIAERLGLSVNTVKTHVSSMLAKLELDDRAALGAWTGEPAEASRRALQGAPALLAPLGGVRRGASALATPAKIAAIGAGTVAFAGVLWIALSGALGENAGDSISGETPSPVAQTASPTATPPPNAEWRTIRGLFTDPRPVGLQDRTRSLAPPPPSPFEPWNGEDVLLYDAQTGTETNLGGGSYARFSPDGTRLAWAAGEPGRLEDLWILDLQSGERRSIGPGRSLRWVDDETLVVHPPGVTNTEELVDIATGNRRPANGINLNPVYRPAEVAGWRLDRVERSEYPAWRTTFELVDLSGTHLPLRFDATAAVLAPDGVLVVATVPENQSGPVFEGPHIEFGTTNIFAVEPETGAATYLASAVASAPNWAFDASKNHVAWMEGFCAAQEPDQPRTRIFDRGDGTVTELDVGLWLVLTPDGRLGRGAFGTTALIDIETLSYTFVLTEEVRDVSWSPDYRYAAIGFQLGHGGPC